MAGQLYAIRGHLRAALNQLEDIMTEQAPENVSAAPDTAAPAPVQDDGSPAATGQPADVQEDAGAAEPDADVENHPAVQAIRAHQDAVNAADPSNQTLNKLRESAEVVLREVLKLL
jgi:hypothetical protein